MKFIVKINDKSARYAYSVYSVFDYENRTCSEDTRVFESDRLSEFIEFMNNPTEKREDPGWTSDDIKE
jgi:hypothetical protein